MGLVQIIATSVAAAITVVAIVLVVRTVRRMISVVRLGQPDPDRGGSRGLRLKTMLAETLGSHPDAALDRRRRRALVRHDRVPRALVAGARGVLRGRRARPRPAADRRLGRLRAGHRVDRRARLHRHPGPDRHPAGEPADATRPARPASPARRCGRRYYVEYTILAVLLCGFFIRGFKAANDTLAGPVWAAPVSHALGAVLPRQRRRGHASSHWRRSSSR